MNRYVIFDMDGTLLDTEQLMIRAWERVAAEHGIAGVVAVCYECIGVSAKETDAIFLRHYGDQFPIELIRKQVISCFQGEIEANGPPIKPFARELLRELKGAGYVMAVASSTVSDMVKRELSKAELLGYFDHIVGGEMVSRSKPAPDIFLAACQQLGCRPEQAVVVEDSLYGIRAAHAAGAIPIMVPDLVQPTEEIRSLCAGVFSSLAQAREFFSLP